MKSLAIHDHEGNIAALFTGPADGPPATVVTEPGQFVTEVDVAESAIDIAELDTEERAEEVLAQYRIHQGRIVRAASGKS
jgi:cytochrome c1